MTTSSYAATNDSSSMEDEKGALQESGWWFHDTASHHCHWYGVICNEAGSVTAILLTNYHKGLGDLTRFNFSSFPNLHRLYLSYCGLNGSIPEQIGTLTKLTYLNLSENDLVGELPLSLVHLTRLKELYIFNTKVTGSIPPGIGNLKNLVHLDLSGNRLVGAIPSSLGQLANLEYLKLHGNFFNSSIPPEMGNLKKLIELNLHANSIVGAIPSSLIHLTSLKRLDLSENQINGSIPLEIGYMKQLDFLLLRNNRLVGSIPSSFGRLTNLTSLDLSDNQIAGSIPGEIGNLNLVELSLTRNNLSVLSSSLGDLVSLSYLRLGSNQIKSSIPPEIGNLKELNALDLSDNLIGGRIPSQLENLNRLSVLNLSHNKLSGTIPPLTHIFNTTPIIDLSYNNLKGHIILELQLAYGQGRARLEHNKGLCGSIKGCHQPGRRRDRRTTLTIVMISISAALFLSLASMGILFFIFRGKITRETKTPTKNGDIFSVWNYDGKIAYEDIISATEDFDMKYCIGSGGYGHVYKAQLPGGAIVALKKLNTSEMEEISITCRESFQKEVQILSEVQHRSIIKLHGFCQHRRCMFLIYQYMENGSLFSMLRNEGGAVKLEWIRRVNIVKSIAYALSYLHHDCTTPIIHRDISSSNILLDSQLNAFVSDFGTAKLLYPNTSNQTLLVGTFGYIAPGTPTI